MIETKKEFVDALAHVEAIRLVGDAAVREWGGDNIPITLLFSELGRAIVQSFDELSHDDRAYVFSVVEQGMKAADTALNTAVATGLLEAISAKTFENPGLAEKIDVYLGEASKKYLIAWEQWLNSR